MPLLLTFLWRSHLATLSFKGMGKCHSTMCLEKTKIPGEQHECLPQTRTVTVHFYVNVAGPRCPDMWSNIIPDVSVRVLF